MNLVSSTETQGGNVSVIQIINDKDSNLFMLVNHCVVNFAICLAGLVGNFMNIVVFYKQGFSTTINISFFGLTISDMSTLLSMLWFTICINPYLDEADTPFVTREIIHLTAGIPHLCFVRIAGWITVLITAERCLCITMPLEIKRILTPRVTIAIIYFIYISIMLSFVPEYESSYFTWKFYLTKNKTLLGMAFTSNRKEVEGVVFFLYAILGSASFFAVIILTIILVVQLKQKSKWRSNANVDKTRSETIASRDRKTMTMVVMIAIVMIVCYLPGITISLTSFFVPDFSVLGTQLNAFFVTWSFAAIFEVINASINIIVYYRMSTKYRETFYDVFCLKKPARRWC